MPRQALLIDEVILEDHAPKHTRQAFRKGRMQDPTHHTTTDVSVRRGGLP